MAFTNSRVVLARHLCLVSHVVNMMDCVICNGIIDSPIVHDDGIILAFLDHEPINPGHVLICPKEHISNFGDLPNEVRNRLFEVAQAIYDKIMKAYNPDGISLMQNNGYFNDLGHFHLHIFPRWIDDGFGWVAKSWNSKDSHWAREKLESEAIKILR